MSTSENPLPCLPGYTLSNRLGAGGYGEVWMASAPGGLTKAVKFIFGAYHEKRAEHEFKALSRIKEVRHPFLLSLERIEIIEGRLVIVTELAEGSLKERFDQCRAQGLPGIPRDELLGYLHDAADGLDYLSSRHSLQHLDVKPENLLVVGGHVKVADFGLVKDLAVSQASLVGGLTPLYSAPEVFQGIPSTRSDQYSLAILYQEMLTGQMPFAGTTAAELTLQHLNDEPNLMPLPLADRYLVARALSKDSQQRYESCTELIKALTQHASPEANSWGSTLPTENLQSFAAPRPEPVTKLFDDDAATAKKESPNSMRLPLPELPAESPRRLSALESPAGYCPQPTLVIGVGGLAAEVLRQFRHRVSQRCGCEPLSTVRILLLDSDSKTIARALEGPARSALRSEETLHLPLRRPQDYREQADRLMRWISRRWLYNIPRSLKTEGLRPLGRLALADHARQTSARIRMALGEIVSAESTIKAKDATGLEFASDAVRVFIVSSISGGSGSGMSLDVACMVRAALDKLGISTTSVVGHFLHASDADPRRCDLAKVNSFAWLTEYNQFHGLHAAYPGDASCGLPPLEAARPALDAAYLVDLGAADADGGFPGVRDVADYIYLETLTPAQSFIDECRRGSNESASYAPLRTFAVERFSAAEDAQIDRAADALARHVILRWVGDTPAEVEAPSTDLSDTDRIVAGTAQLVGQLQLNLEGLASHARGLIDARLGDDLAGYGALALEEANLANKQAMVNAVARVDELFASSSEDSSEVFVLGRPLDAIVSPLTAKLSSDVERWIFTRIDDRKERLDGACRVAQWLTEHLKSVEAGADRHAAALARQVAAHREGRDTRRDATGPDQRLQFIIAYLRLRTDHCAVIAVAGICRRLLAEIKSLSNTITEFGRHLKHLANNLGAGDRSTKPAATDKSANEAALRGSALAVALSRRMGPLAQQVDERIQVEFLNHHGGLFQTVMGHSRTRAQMLKMLASYACEAIDQLSAEPDVLKATLETACERGAVASNGGDARNLPSLLARGGVYRKLIVIPECPATSDANADEQAPSGGSATVVRAAGHELFVCYEAWQLPLPLIAADLIEARRDYAEFAARVHTRSDVSWTPLLAVAGAAPPQVGADPWPAPVAPYADSLACAND